MTGFAKDLFADQSLDPKAMVRNDHTIINAAITAAQDKEAKLRYLQQLSAAVHAATGDPVTFNPAKVLAGLEPEATNAFLQLLATAATKQLTAAPAKAPPANTEAPKSADGASREAHEKTPLATKDDAGQVATIAAMAPPNPTRPTTARRAPPRAAFQRATSIIRPGTASGIHTKVCSCLTTKVPHLHRRCASHSGTHPAASSSQQCHRWR